MNTKLTFMGAMGSLWGSINMLTTELFNVSSLGVIGLAFTGALLSYAYNVDDEKPVSRRKFYISIVANTLTAVAAVSIIPGLLGWEWYDKKMEGSLAFLFALVARFAIPFFFKSGPELFRRWFRIGEYRQQTEVNNETK